MMTLLLLATLMAACTGKDHHAGPSGSAVEGDSLVVTIDSLGIGMTLLSDRPDTVMEATVASLLAERLFFTEYGQEPVAQPAYAGDFSQFARDCARRKWAEMFDQTFGHYPERATDDEEAISRAEAVEAAARAMREDTICASTCRAALRRVYDSDSLQSWQFDYDIYIAQTAHPSMGTWGVTLRKRDCRPVGQLLRDTEQPAFRRLLKQRLRAWLMVEMEEPEVTDELLTGYLSETVGSVDELPLPKLPPYLTGKGVALCYDEGELLGAVHSSVVLVLPYDKVRNYMER